MSTPHYRRFLIAVAAVTLATASTACSSLSPNKGGDTTCNEYLDMTGDEQSETIKNFLEEKGDSDPSGFDVNLSKGSAQLYCNTMGSGSDPIRKIDTG